MILDVHTHIFSPNVMGKRDQYCASDACFGLLYSNRKAKICCTEDLIRSMDDNGIPVSVIQNIGWVNHEECMRSNDYILESVSKYPERLIGFCAVQPREGEKALKEIIRCRKGGAKGIGELRPDIQGFDLADPGLMKPLMEEIIKQGMILSLHASEPVGHEYAGKGDITPGILYKFISNYQEATIFLGHFGGGLVFYELMPEVRVILTNTYYDTAAAPFLYVQGIYEAIIKAAGSGKILFGSDWPLLDPQRVINHINSAGLKDFDVKAIIGENSRRLLGLC